MTNTKTKVFWKAQELTELSKHYIDFKMRGNSMTDSIRLAQEAFLPKERHRNIHCMSQMPKGWTELVDIAKKDYIEAQRLEKAIPKPEVEPVLESKKQSTPDLSFGDILGMAQKQFMDTVLTALANKVADLVISKLQDSSVGAATLSPQIQEALHVHVRKHNAEGIQEPKVAKTKVVIIGMLPRQLENLIPEYPMLELSVIEKVTSAKKIASKLANADRVISMTTHMSHSLEEQVKASVKRGCYKRIHGGLTKFREELTRLSVSLNELAG